jgi:hypothetical protein
VSLAAATFVANISRGRSGTGGRGKDGEGTDVLALLGPADCQIEQRDHSPILSLESSQEAWGRGCLFEPNICSGYSPF